MASSYDEKIFAVHNEKWHTPASNYPQNEFGEVRLKSINYKPGIYPCYGMRGYQYFQVIKMLPVMTLQRKFTPIKQRQSEHWHAWMVDDIPHWWAMQDYASKCSGDVLVGGLGLGLIIHALCANPSVQHIHVVDYDSDVIKLVAPLLPKGSKASIEIVDADFFDWWYDDEKNWDNVILDLWVTKGKDQTIRLEKNTIAPLYRYLCKRYPWGESFIHGFMSAHRTAEGKYMRHVHLSNFPGYRGGLN